MRLDPNPRNVSRDPLTGRFAENSFEGYDTDDEIVKFDPHESIETPWDYMAHGEIESDNEGDEILEEDEIAYADELSAQLADYASEEIVEPDLRGEEIEELLSQPFRQVESWRQPPEHNHSGHKVRKAWALHPSRAPHFDLSTLYEQGETGEREHLKTLTVTPPEETLLSEVESSAA